MVLLTKVIDMLKKLSAVVAVAAVSALSLGSAHAAIDVTDVVTEIGATLAPIGLLGSAVLLVVVAIKAFHWVRRAM